MPGSSAFNSVTYDIKTSLFISYQVHYTSVSQQPGRGLVPDLGLNYTWSREVLLEFVVLIL